MLSNDTVPCDMASLSSKGPSSSSSAVASLSSPCTGTTSSDAEQECSKLLEHLPSEGAQDPAREPASHLSPEPDSNDPELLEPDALPDPEPDPEEDEPNLERWE